MDSEGVQQAAAMNGSADEKNKLDLELRLGLPDTGENPPKDQGQQFDLTLLATDNYADLSHLALRSQVWLLLQFLAFRFSFFFGIIIDCAYNT